MPRTIITCVAATSGSASEPNRHDWTGLLEFLSSPALQAHRLGQVMAGDFAPLVERKLARENVTLPQLRE